jgi:hypothetical protein
MGLQTWVQHNILADMAMATGQPIRESLRKPVTSLFTNPDAPLAVRCWLLNIGLPGGEEASISVAVGR